MTDSAASTASPITNTLLTVPRPGICRSGIQASSTHAPVMITTVPNDSPVWFAMPWWNTSHGSSPSPARSWKAMLVP